MPSLPTVADAFENVLPVTVRFNDPLAFVTIRPFSADPVTVELAIEPVPVSPPTKSTPLSLTALPFPDTSEFESENPFTAVPRIPSSPPLLTLIRVRLTPPPTFVRFMPGPLEPWIAPPVQSAAPVHAPPFPATVSPPVEPVPLSTRPLPAPF